jgi:hypothetical protein
VLAVVAITTVTSGVAYEGARLKNEQSRLVDKAEAREAHLAFEHKREVDKAEAEVKRLADKSEIYHYMAQVAGTHDYERLWRNLQETGKGQGGNGNAPPGRSLSGVDLLPGGKERLGGGKETAAAGGGMGKGKEED